MKHDFITMAVSLFFVVTAVSAQTPSTGWYNDNAGAASFTISTADELAGLAQIVNGTWGGEPVWDDFLGKTIILNNNIDLSAYDNWVPIGNNTLTDSNSIFSGTFDGAGYTISKLTINRPDTYCQGLFGVIVRGKVENLRLDDVNIKGYDFAGGVAGAICSSSSVVNSYSAGIISGNDGVGGVAGVVFNNSSVTGSYFAGVINGIGSIAGGVAGWLNDSGSMVNCYSTGTVNGYNSVGGVVGSVSKSSSVAGSYFTGEVDGYNSVGGVAGEVSTSSVTGCYSTGAVSGVYISGGVTGSVHNNSAVINCYSTGTVSGTYSYFGGVAGVVILSSLTNCYSTGEVIGRSSVGGVVGVVSFSSVFNCYSTGAVSGKSEVGGVVGVIGDGKVYNCATLNAEVKGDSLTGRVAGRIGNSNSIEYPLANNVAYTGIKNKDGIFDWANIGSYDLDGADITIAEILADGTIGGRFTAENGWTIAAGSLPGLLGNAVSMPAHLGGASVKFSKPSLYSKSSARFISASGRTLRLRLSERGNVSVYALNGAKLRTFDLAGGSHSLTVNDLPRGMYVVRAVSGSWKQSVRLTLK